MKNELIKISKIIQFLPNAEIMLEKTRQILGAKNGNQGKWQAALEQLEKMNKASIVNHKGIIYITLKQNTSTLESCFECFIPWRKGPFQLGDLLLESEWRSDMKWARLQPHIGSLQGQTILDVGCGNGYFGYQMLLFGAKLVLGLEPFLLFNYQYYALSKLIDPALKLAILPLRLSDLKPNKTFDTVFSMGVLYHQKSPIEHLLQLKQQLKPGGRLILETLIVPGKLGYQLLPKDRYAKMRNVWFLPSIPTLFSYLERCGFRHNTLVDVNQTSTQEQRSTKWMGDNNASLVDFLQLGDFNLTIEGYPAPRRAIIVCHTI